MHSSPSYYIVLNAVANLYIIFGSVDAENNINVPNKYIDIVFLYSAFSSTLPNIYFIPIIINIITEETIPITLITPNIFPIFSCTSGSSGLNVFG